MAKLGYYFLITILYIFSLLPLKFLYFLSDCVAFLLRKVIRYRSEVVFINISKSFPDINYGGIKKIAKGFYRNFSDIFIEVLWSVSASKKSYHSMIEVENPEVIKKFYDQGKSIIVVLGHQANWETTAVMNVSLSGFTLSDYRMVYKKQKNRSADMLIKRIRIHHNQGQFVESNEIARYMYRHKSERLLYALVADQSPHPGAKFAVNFLNQPTLMLNGPELLSRKYDIPIVYLNNTRVERGKYRVKLTVIAEEPSKTESGYISGKFASLLEEGIRQQPSEWLWSHRRWKRSVDELKNSKQDKNE